MKTGIGILDLYDDDSLMECLKYIPENHHVTVITNRKSDYKNEKIKTKLK